MNTTAVAARKAFLRREQAVKPETVQASTAIVLLLLYVYSVRSSKKTRFGMLRVHRLHASCCIFAAAAKLGDGCFLDAPPFSHVDVLGASDVHTKYSYILLFNTFMHAGQTAHAKRL